jgi:hypothetical protein
LCSITQQKPQPEGTRIRQRPYASALTARNSRERDVLAQYAVVNERLSHPQARVAAGEKAAREMGRVFGDEEGFMAVIASIDKSIDGASSLWAQASDVPDKWLPVITALYAFQGFTIERTYSYSNHPGFGGFDVAFADVDLSHGFLDLEKLIVEVRRVLDDAGLRASIRCQRWRKDWLS